MPRSSWRNLVDISRTIANFIDLFGHASDVRKLTVQQIKTPVYLGKYRYTIFQRVCADVECMEIACVIHCARVKDLGALPEDE